jgi:hypothetical protein
MKIAFFTEGGYFGKVPRNNPIMRTDQAWICALDAVHIPIFSESFPNENFDVGIVIIPKEKNREYLAVNQVDLIQNIKSLCKKVYVMQESIQWDWQDEPFISMAWFYKQLIYSDGVLCHNDIDVPFFGGVTNKPAFVLPTLMIDNGITQSKTKEEKVFVSKKLNERTQKYQNKWVDALVESVKPSEKNKSTEKVKIYDKTVKVNQTVNSMIDYINKMLDE